MIIQSQHGKFAINYVKKKTAENIVKYFCIATKNRRVSDLNLVSIQKLQIGALFRLLKKKKKKIVFLQLIQFSLFRQNLK